MAVLSVPVVPLVKKREYKKGLDLLVASQDLPLLGFPLSAPYSRTPKAPTEDKLKAQPFHRPFPECPSHISPLAVRPSKRFVIHLTRSIAIRSCISKKTRAIAHAEQITFAQALTQTAYLYDEATKSESPITLVRSSSIQNLSTPQ